MRFSSLILTLVFFLAACGGGGQDPGSSDPPDPNGGDYTPTGTASITGTVSFDGEVPEATPIRMKPECMDLHDTTPMSASAVVNDGAVQNTFVYVSSGLPDGYSYATPSEPAVLDQEGCLYLPRVLGMQTGQTLRIDNSDPFQHNVHPVPEENRGFNESTPGEGDFLEKTFLVPEVMISVKCDVHAWMQAYIGVLDHPYYATTGADGSFAIEGLPAGTYTVTTWHEHLGAQEVEVTVGDGESQQADVAYSAAG